MGDLLKTALCVGGAASWKDDLLRFYQLAGEDWADLVIACNDVGCIIEPLDHWTSLHPEKFRGWRTDRRALKLSENYESWASSKPQFVDHVLNNWFNGSSGLLNVDVALNRLAVERVVCIGTPMDATPNDFTGRAWEDCTRYRKGWTSRRHALLGPVRSMSGWTYQQLGGPDAKFLDKTRAVRRRSSPTPQRGDGARVTRGLAR